MQRCQEQELGAPGCSQSLNRRLTALRDSLPMGNSASSTRKAAWLTERGTYRGPPTCTSPVAQGDYKDSALPDTPRSTLLTCQEAPDGALGLHGANEIHA